MNSFALNKQYLIIHLFRGERERCLLSILLEGYIIYKRTILTYERQQLSGYNLGICRAFAAFWEDYF